MLRGGEQLVQNIDWCLGTEGLSLDMSRIIWVSKRTNSS